MKCDVNNGGERLRNEYHSLQLIKVNILALLLCTTKGLVVCGVSSILYPEPDDESLTELFSTHGVASQEFIRRKKIHIPK